VIIRRIPVAKILVISTAIAGSGTAHAADASSAALSEIIVNPTRVANTEPAGTFASAITVLRFDPQTEIQSRGMPEGQGDVTVRGGLFENTGFKLGAATIVDPQTGHYVAELPIDPALLSAPLILTGVDNALAGFNSNVATIVYGIPALRQSAEVNLGVGTDSLMFSSARYADVTRYKDAQYGLQVSGAVSEGEGTVSNGDHEFSRFNLQAQRVAGNTQTDLIIAYQDKFFAWPGAYTGFASLPETDDTQTTLVLANHRTTLERGWLQMSGFYRSLDDNYDFDRRNKESGGAGAFEHRTRNYGAAFEGNVDFANLNWEFNGQVSRDSLVSSTDLNTDLLDGRYYGSFRLAPSYDFAVPNDQTVTIRFGGVVDTSSQDSNAVSPVFDITLKTPTRSGQRTLKAEFAGTSQVPGYTALNSKPNGLFGGNANLSREKARQFIVTLAQEGRDWFASAAAFHREDENLVDWTYASGSPSARQANSVYMEVNGLELLLRKQWQRLDLSLGYTYLDKKSDYGTATVDGSFYALNYARDRATVSVSYQLNETYALRLDSEYRNQLANPLRTSDNNSLLSAASLDWTSPQFDEITAQLRIDNLTDDDYQPFPGTPAVGRQISLNVRYNF
tara:strand:+ start:9899 stop:11758 length:1860 start_codon:yes stop_codon:yes gene_type:complete